MQEVESPDSFEKLFKAVEEKDKWYQLRERVAKQMEASMLPKKKKSRKGDKEEGDKEEHGKQGNKEEHGKQGES